MENTNEAQAEAKETPVEQKEEAGAKNYTEANLRKRAQTAESKLAELQTEYESIFSQFNEAKKQLDTVTFETTRNGKINEFVNALPEGKQLKDKDLFTKYATRLPRDEFDNLFSELQQDFLVDATPVVATTPETKQQEVTPFKSVPAAPTIDIGVDASDPYAMVQLWKSNPALAQQVMAKKG